MENEWTKWQKTQSPKKNVYELMTHLHWRVLEYRDIPSSMGGYRLSYIYDNKQAAEQACTEARAVAREIGVRVFKTRTRKYFDGGPTGLSDDWRDNYTFIYDSDDPQDIVEWNALMDQYEMPRATDWRDEPTDYDSRPAFHGRHHKGLGIKFIAKEASKYPGFDEFIAKAGTPKYWADIIVEPYYPEEDEDELAR